jgi:hypothetical protein
MQATAEAVASAKFQSLIEDLRKTWEEDEAARARQLEKRLRSHYDIVLQVGEAPHDYKGPGAGLTGVVSGWQHMQSQLELALRVNDEADKQWLEDVETRNKMQIEVSDSFSVEPACSWLTGGGLNRP